MCAHMHISLWACMLESAVLTVPKPLGLFKKAERMQFYSRHFSAFMHPQLEKKKTKLSDFWEFYYKN